MSVVIRPATVDDADAIWGIVAPIVEVGDAFAFDGPGAREDVLAMFFSPAGRSFVASLEGGGTMEERVEVPVGAPIGAYVLKPNQLGRGSHVANAAYAVHPEAQGRGVARGDGGTFDR